MNNSFLIYHPVNKFFLPYYSIVYNKKKLKNLSILCLSDSSTFAEAFAHFSTKYNLNYTISPTFHDLQTLYKNVFTQKNIKLFDVIASDNNTDILPYLKKLKINGSLILKNNNYKSIIPYFKYTRTHLDFIHFCDFQGLKKIKHTKINKTHDYQNVFDITFAKKYNLEVIPQKFETNALKYLYTLDSPEIHNFTHYHDKCTFNTNILHKQKYHYTWEELNKYKNKINIYKFAIDTRNSQEWRKTTLSINLGLFIKKYLDQELDVKRASRAFLKMYEILAVYKLIPKKLTTLNSLHVCEAPGKFIAATNYYIKGHTKIKNFHWFANSLNPYNKQNKKKYGFVFGDQYGYLKRYPKKWLWGSDNTGDITLPKNIINISQKAKNIQLFTSDCGLNVMDDPNQQEKTLSILNLAHSILALLTLSIGGHAVLKVFLPLTESITVSIIYLLYCHFKKISIIKQLSGSHGSSEVYIVCKHLNYKINNDMKHYLLDFLKDFNPDNALFPKDDIPDSFIKQLNSFIEIFTKKQKNYLQKASSITIILIYSKNICPSSENIIQTAQMG